MKICKSLRRRRNSICNILIVKLKMDIFQTHFTTFVRVNFYCFYFLVQSGFYDLHLSNNMISRQFSTRVTLKNMIHLTSLQHLYWNNLIYLILFQLSKLHCISPHLNYCHFNSCGSSQFLLTKCIFVIKRGEKL